ncbi:MAG TPA: hypothetical protein VM511_07225, partial [Luteolibacter sp.]|nr:hypothetical protein [Luteolibacter sp.]
MRVVVPEILDHLPADDPRAVRSRRDLRMINGLMGNDRWILRTLERFPEIASRGITEIGAGDGNLIRKIAAGFPGNPIQAIDLAPRPPGIPDSVTWHQDDLFKTSAD